MQLNEQMRSLVAYDGWANEKILECTEGLSDEALGATPLAGVRGIRDTLIHALMTRVWWMSRWKGTDFVMPDVSTPAALRATDAGVHEQLTTYVGSLSDDDLGRPIEAFGPMLPLSSVVAQVMLHGVQHRAELASMLTAVGRSPGDLDYIFFRRDHA